MEIVVAIAIGLATLGTKLLDYITAEGSYWDTDRILGLVSSICLSLFAILLFLEAMYDEDDEGDTTSSWGPGGTTFDGRRTPEAIEVYVREKKVLTVKDW